MDNRHSPPPSPSPPESITVTGLDCHYGRHLAVKGIDLIIPAGEVTALVGHN